MGWDALLPRMILRLTLLYAPAQALAPAAQFVSIIVWTYWLAPAEMGRFALIAATQELAHLLTLSWFCDYTLRFAGGQDAAERRRLLDAESAVLALCALIQIPIAAIALLAVSRDAPSIWSVAIVALFFATRSINIQYAERARAEHRISAYTLLQCAGPAGGLALGLAMLPIVGSSSDTLFGAYAIAQALGAALALPLMGGVSQRPRFDRGALRAAFGYGGPITLLSGLGWAAENNLRFIVDRVAGAATLGLVSVGWSIGRRAASLGAMLVTTAAFPVAARLLNEGRRDEALKRLSDNALMLIGALAPIVVGVSLVAEAAATLLVAAPYRGMTTEILGLATLAGAIRFFRVHGPDQFLVLERRFLFAGAIDMVEIAATASLTLIGLLFHGAAGAVAGAAAGSLVATILSLFVAARYGFQTPFAGVLKIAAATGAMAAVVALVPWPSSALGLAGAVAVGAAVYGVALLALFPTEAIAARRSLRGRSD
jgi:O-antigen/teichoic acid export membrane protein